MGKKKKGKKKVSSSGKPLVSICTPTYNRRRFLPFLIKCFKAQTYPKELMEWIIIDDGEDNVEDIFMDPSLDDSMKRCIKYYRVEKKMKLGRKRNFMHEKCKGEIIVYMDDDDYYPPERVNHAVNKLRSKPKAIVAGSSIIYIYFKHMDMVYRFGPYGPSHSTAGTFAFKRELLLETKYDDDAEMAEEKEFLKNYTFPMVQLDTMKTILVFAHDHNTFDKKKLLVNPHPKFVGKTGMKPNAFIKDKKMREFYMSQ
jgi:glycosyltransferase involved in cell wall biosynthesis